MKDRKDIRNGDVFFDHDHNVLYVTEGTITKNFYTIDSAWYQSILQIGDEIYSNGFIFLFNVDDIN